MFMFHLYVWGLFSHPPHLGSAVQIAWINNSDLDLPKRIIYVAWFLNIFCFWSGIWKNLYRTVLLHMMFSDFAIQAISQFIKISLLFNLLKILWISSEYSPSDLFYRDLNLTTTTIPRQYLKLRRIELSTLPTPSHPEALKSTVT